MQMLAIRCHVHWSTEKFKYRYCGRSEKKKPLRKQKKTIARARLRCYIVAPNVSLAVCFNNVASLMFVHCRSKPTYFMRRSFTKNFTTKMASSPAKSNIDSPADLTSIYDNQYTCKKQRPVGAAIWRRSDEVGNVERDSVKRLYTGCPHLFSTAVINISVTFDDLNILSTAASCRDYYDNDIFIVIPL